MHKQLMVPQIPNPVGEGVAILEAAVVVITVVVAVVQVTMGDYLMEALLEVH